MTIRFAATFCVAAFFGSSFAAEPVDYLTQIKPILSEKCYSCHGTLKQESSLRLETRTLMVDGGDSGEVIVPGDAEDSLLIERIMATGDERMPPREDGSPLKSAEIELLRRWIDQGAESPPEETPVSPLDHWAFQKLVRPEVPASSFANPIDSLLHAKHQKQGLVRQSPAPRSIAIRRLYLDLIGLPPTRQQLKDERPWSEIVNELLASPQHGERWARHWMDVWRYSDWYGLGAQLRYSQKHLWHWRDWIIRSLNEDKGYDRMVMEMLAGDELAPNDPEVVAGTGYLARSYYLFNRTTWLDSTIEHTGKAFLGLTLNCAKCHDHKYDPISQLDYYRFRAILEPHQVRLDPVPGETNLEKDGLPRVFDDQLDAKTYLHQRGDPKSPDLENEIKPGVPAILAQFAPEIRPVVLPPDAYAPGSRDYVQQDHLRVAKEKLKGAEAELKKSRVALSEAPSETQETATKTDEPESFELVDEFDQPNDQLWQIVGEGWEYRDGAIHQKVATRQKSMLKLQKTVPDDFELTCRYTTTGGATYKSVTFRFDQSDDGTFANYVYTSAHAPGPKVQVAYTRNGNDAYPPTGRASRKIAIGTTYTIRFAVRGTLVNVWLNDDFVIAYRLPDRARGFVSLSAFDATAAFDSIKIRSLPADLSLTEAKNRSQPTRSQVETNVAIAEAKLAAALAAVTSLEATIAADKNKYRTDVSDDEEQQLAVNAARAQLELRWKDAIVVTLSETDDKKVNAAKKTIREAEEQLAVVASDKRSYQTIRASRKALETPAHKEVDYPPTYPSTSTGRRLALARWITSRDNPLTARVAVNHVWTRHFGEPLVDSVFDFGLRAKKPIHADILDLLAYEFIESGWSFRHLHRLIVTSETYQLSSSTRDADPTTASADQQNQMYWRMNSRRMEAQVVRDTLLSAAGALDDAIGGPSIDPKNAGTRRSLYFMHSRDQQDKFLSMFDDADLLQCYRRSESVVPQQALALSNSKLSIEMASKIAVRLHGELATPDWNAFVAATFEALLGRSPTTSEAGECDIFRDQMRDLLAAKGGDDLDARIRERFVHAILNHNDFIAVR